MSVFIHLYKYFISVANSAQPLMLLTMRLWIAHVFWVSGLVKIDDFSTTVALFADEYQVPLLPPYFAALSGTFFELACPVLLAFGFMARAATLPLLTMTAVIQFTYDQNVQHVYWAMLLGAILVFGAGKWSLDHVIKLRFGGK